MLPDSGKVVLKIKRTLTSIKGDVRELTPSTINRYLDRLDEASETMTDVFIAEGRGHETPSETFQMSDPLAILARDLYDARSMLRDEISRRWGPGAPRRLPTHFRRSP